MSSAVDLSIFVLAVFCTVSIDCKCTTTFITSCEKVEDLARYGKDDWKNLILENDRCSDPGDPSGETLNAGAFNKTSKLEEIYIIGKLTEIKPGAFDGLNQLTYLKLFDNSVKVLPRDALGKLKKLFKLDLSDNQIENLSHGVFQGSKITTIILSNNKISHISVDMLDSSNLKNLIVTNNRLEFLAENCFGPNLEYLNLDHNNLEEISVNVFSNLKKLKVLFLSNNNLQFIKPVTGLESLMKLDLSHNKIRFIEDNAFSAFPELKRLDLNHNVLKYLSANIFKSKVPLEVTMLLLHYNRLTNLDSKLSDVLPQIQEISIGGNPWPCPCLTAIEQYFQVKQIKKLECDREYSGRGTSPVCYITGSKTCSGTEEATDDIYSNFLKSLRRNDC